MTGDYSDDEDPWKGRGRAGEEEDEGALEYFVLQESTGYMAPTLRCLAILHTIISFLCVVGYYYLKVCSFLRWSNEFVKHCRCKNKTAHMWSIKKIK